MEILRKIKDNGHREKENSMKMKELQNKTDYDTKCNIQKGKSSIHFILFYSHNDIEFLHLW